MLLAGLGAIISAISGVADLVDAGKRVYEEVTGQPSAAASAEDLGREVATLPPDQGQVWLQRMQAEVEQYKAQSARIANEQGEVTADILRALPPAAAAKVALLRMTTRPVMVRRMGHLLLMPLYLMAIDGLIMLVNIFTGSSYALVAGQMFAEGSIYKGLYAEAVGWAAAIVMTYMLAREVGKAMAKGGEPDLAGAVGKIGQAMGGLRGLFKR